MSQSYSNVLVIDANTAVVEDDDDDRKFDLSITNSMAVNASVNADIDARFEDNEVFDEKLVEDEPTEDYTFVKVGDVVKIAQGIISNKLTKKAAEKLTGLMDGLYKHLAKNITIEDDTVGTTSDDIRNLIDDVFTGKLHDEIICKCDAVLSKYQTYQELNEGKKKKGVVYENSLAKIVSLIPSTYMSRSYVGYYKYNKSDRKSLRSINTQAILCYTCAVEKTIELVLENAAEYARIRGRIRVKDSDLDAVIERSGDLSHVFDSM